MPELYPDDQKKVDTYLKKENAGEGERKPFNPWLLFLIVLMVLGLLTLASFLIAKNHGVV